MRVPLRGVTSGGAPFNMSRTLSIGKVGPGPGSPGQALSVGDADVNPYQNGDGKECRMYSYEDKMRAVKLFIKYNKSCMSVINELGYPSRPQLKAWHKEFVENGGLSRGCHPRYDGLQKRAAVDHFFEHGQCLARTVRQLGYPKSRELLAEWVDKLGPGRRRKRAKGGSYTDDQKREAVVALVSRKASAEEASDAVGVTRAVLYKWKTSFSKRSRRPR